MVQYDTFILHCHKNTTAKKFACLHVTVEVATASQRAGVVRTEIQQQYSFKYH